MLNLNWVNKFNLACQLVDKECCVELVMLKVREKGMNGVGWYLCFICSNPDYVLPPS